MFTLILEISPLSTSTTRNIVSLFIINSYYFLLDILAVKVPAFLILFERNIFMNTAYET